MAIPIPGPAQGTRYIAILRLDILLDPSDWDPVREKVERDVTAALRAGTAIVLPSLITLEALIDTENNQVIPYREEVEKCQSGE